jgi:hypothetical protein
VKDIHLERDSSEETKLIYYNSINFESAQKNPEKRQ